MSVLWNTTRLKGTTDILMSGDTITDIFWNGVTARGPQLMMREKKFGIWQHWNWQQAGEAVRQISMGLMANGFEAGDCASILSNTRLEWVLADMAVLSAGGVSNGIYPTDSVSQVQYLCEDSRTTVLFVEDDQLVAAEGKFEIRIPLSQIPLTRSGAIGFQIENAMASVAAAWASDIPWTTIALGLSTFVSDAMAVPGRFNVFDYKGATLIADYGHNPDAIKALVQAVTNLPANRRSVVISGAGDRRDEDIRQQTRIIGEAFDDVVLFQDACQRGRADGEVLALLRQGLDGARRTSHIEEIRGEFTAIDAAIDRLTPGDLCLILIDQIEEALAHITRRVHENRSSLNEH